MPRQPSLNYWAERDLWYFNKDRQRHFIDHPEGEKKPKKAADGWKPIPDQVREEFYKILSAKTTPEVRSDAVAAVMDAFLAWSLENRAAKTWRGYKDFCQSFLDKYGTISVGELKPFHVQNWINEQTSWNSTTKRGAVTCLKRVMRWAVKFGYIESSPISEMEKPQALTRTKTITPEEFETLLNAVPEDDTFRDLLILSWDLGGRPQEIKGLEARHVDFDKRVCILPTQEEKKKRAPRVIFITTDRALQILQRCCEQYPAGKILRNRLGNPWTASAVKIRFRNLQEKLGKRYCQYMLRHTWITRALAGGMDSHKVAKASGHSSTAMLDKVYSHVAEDYGHMLSELQSALTPSETAASASSSGAVPKQGGKTRTR